MSELIRCTRCILPGTLSAVTFDENGVCNHCRKYDADFKEWDSIKERREQEFKAILLHAKKLKRPYDVLVPLSGGKDSTYALYLCSKVYALKVLAVTLDNGYLTQPARNNISNALKCCSADHIYYTLNRENSDELFSIFTRKTGDFCNACMRSINYSIEFASRIFRIPLIVKT
jgi:tRNA(Ile)-lysidine synthase TilS/MesJ